MTDDDIDRRLTRDAAAWTSSATQPRVSLTGAVERAAAEQPAGPELTCRRPWRRLRRGGFRWRGARVGNVTVAVGVLVLLGALLIPFALTRAGGGADSGQHSAVTGPVTTPAALACPDDFTGPSVLAKPTIPDGNDRLVPQRSPLSALVCAYRSTSGSQLGLTVPVTKNLGDVAQLSWLPRLLPGQQGECAGVGFDGPYASLLLGVRYADGMVWVNGSANTTDCTEATNGAFTSSMSASEAILALAKANGQPIPSATLSPPSGPADPCQAGVAVGRYGQEISMVPAGADRVTVCQVLTSHNLDSYRHVTSTAVTDLADALNTAPTTPIGSVNTCPESGPTAFYEARFDYPVGPAVLVQVLVGCSAPVDNSSLQSTNGAAAAAIAEQMLAGH